MPVTDKEQQKLKALGARVKDIRKQKGFTLKELAHSIDKDPQSVHRLEMGGINPSYLYLLQLCEGLGISVEELIKEGTPDQL